MTYAEELYEDIRLLLSSNASMPLRYHQLRRILDRMLKERTQDDEIEYFGLLPRIYSLCQRYHTPHLPLCILHTNIIRGTKGEYQPDDSEWLYDVKALAQGISDFYEVPVPPAIHRLLPIQWRAWKEDSLHKGTIIRFVVKEWDEEYIYGYDSEDSSQTLLKVVYDSKWNLSTQLYSLATLNLLDTAISSDGSLCPRLFVLEPDYLVDITTICQCIKESGSTPLFYLMEKFLPREETLAIQLGNAANQFLDDTIHGTASFQHSMQKIFRDYPLQYCTLEGVDNNYFEQCMGHFRNIQQAVRLHFIDAGIDAEHDGIQLEPSFICDTLGLQGRMDLLTTDLDKIVELKSGKQDEFHGTFRLEHALQMALYKEILHYSLGRSRRDVKTLLLYSRYPHLYDIRLGNSYIEQAMMMRNGIVYIDRQLRTNASDFLRSLKEDDFNPLQSQSKLYTHFIQPRVSSFLHTLHAATPLEYEYFTTMLSFVAREQMLAKVGDDRPDGDRGFAQAWLCDTETKRLHGNILTDLKLALIHDEKGLLTHVRATLPLYDTSQPNFREGDNVVLYERNAEGDLITNRQSLRCYVEELHSDSILLRLCHPQRGASGLSLASSYAIEPAHSDALFSTMYRGLYAFLTCPLSRRNLILGLREPSSFTSCKLENDVENQVVENVVSGAVQSRDYYLLVGPPGSGKTNIALRGLLAELLHHADENILLMAYTNRAVDEICQMIEAMPEHPTYLRIGQELSCAPQFRSRLLRNAISHCRDRRSTLEKVHPVRIFCGTVVSLCSATELFRLKHFQTAILDEASQVLEPQLLPLMVATLGDTPCIDRFIFIGDHKQLPAVVVQSATRSAVESPLLHSIGLRNCRDSLFERLHRISPSRFVGMLTQQGRMHADITRWASQSYYEGMLQVVPLPHQTAPLPWSIYDASDSYQKELATQRMLVRDIRSYERTAQNKVNAAEAEDVAALVEALYRLHLLNDMEWRPDYSVGIIVPFRAQIARVRQSLAIRQIPGSEIITVDTVERYQGSQRDTIIFSTVVSQPYQMQILSNPVESAGLSIDRKLNVAVTRARNQFVLVGNVPLLEQSPDYRHLIGYSRDLSPNEHMKKRLDSPK